MANYAQKTLGAFIVNNDDAFLRSVSVTSKAKKTCSKNVFLVMHRKALLRQALLTGNQSLVDDKSGA